MHGIHLINNSERGVSIQFYVILIVALLQLKLKQYTLLQYEQENQGTDTDADPNADTDQETDAETNVDNSTSKAATASGKPISHPYQFFDMIGEKLKKYWKIGIHWLSALRKILDHPFDNAAIEILASG